MNLFDIAGPIMVGPSSSHTAGAVKIGYVSLKLLAEPVKKAEILLYGSFLATGKGHGTDFAIVAGLLGMKPDDERIPDSINLAKEQGIEITFGQADLSDAHPNSVLLNLTGESGESLSLVGESIGGSLINIAKMNGQAANFSGERPTLIIHNQDKPGCVANITALLSRENINIATMHLYRTNRGGNAVIMIECDDAVPMNITSALKELNGIDKVTYYNPF